MKEANRELIEGTWQEWVGLGILLISGSCFAIGLIGGLRAWWKQKKEKKKESK